MPRQLVFSLIFLLSIFITINCGSSVQEIKEISSSVSKPIEVTYGVKMIYSDMGNSKLQLISPEVHRFEKENEMIMLCPKGMELTFYDTLQRVESVLVSDYGKLYTKEQYMIVRDNVIFHNSNHDTLFTDLLNIYFEKDSIYTDQTVKVSSENGVLLGEELIANSNFTFYRLLNIKESHIKYEE